MREGANVRELPSPLRNDRIAALDGCAALITDLAPWDDSVVITLHWVRRAKPVLPILLFTPNGPGVARLLLECGRIDGVHARSQAETEPSKLRTDIRSRLDGIGGMALLGVVRLVLPKSPRAVEDFVRVAVKTILKERDVASLTVDRVSSRLGMSTRSLHRCWPSTSLPNPKELLDWLLLLFVSQRAQCSGLAMSTIAGHVRMDRQRVYRIRQRLFRGESEVTPCNAAQQFDLALLAFFERCGVPSHEAMALKQKLLA